MEIFEITQVYGAGPFGHAGAARIFVGPTIKGWLDLAADGSRRYAPEGVIHDIFVMSPLTWRGRRSHGGIAFSSRRIMARLESLTDRIADPQVRLFTGVFPRLKGQPCSQILWWKPLPPRCVLIGAEEDLPGLQGPLTRHESGEPPAHPDHSWVGIGRVEIDWNKLSEHVDRTADGKAAASIRPWFDPDVSEPVPGPAGG